jgi:hypothetical protein
MTNGTQNVSTLSCASLAALDLVGQLGGATASAGGSLNCTTTLWSPGGWCVGLNFSGVYPMDTPATASDSGTISPAPLLAVFDGPSTTAPLLMSISGTLNQVQASSSFVVGCTGRAAWRTL